MTRTQVDDASTVEASPDTACDFPGFEKLLPGQATGGAHGARDPMEMRVGGESGEIATGETGL